METETKTEQKEYIKLMKMSKGYQWEIKVLAYDSEVGLGLGELKRLEFIDGELKLKYGSENGI